MRSYIATPKDVTSAWHIIDADGQVLGRIATHAAKLLQGKHKATYTPFIDTGDHVVIVNVDKVKLTGRKEDQKIYRRHSGYLGGLREERARVVRQARPQRLGKAPAMGPALGRLLGQGAQQHFVHMRRQRCTQQAGRCGHLVADLVERGEIGIAVKGAAAGEQLINDHRQ